MDVSCWFVIKDFFYKVCIYLYLNPRHINNSDDPHVVFRGKGRLEKAVSHWASAKRPTMEFVFLHHL